MIDLHIHTVNSDGDFTPEEILKKAELNGIKYISFTDHNNINTYADLDKLNVASLFSGVIVTGVEFEFCYKGRLFDMLGYGVDLSVLKSSKIIKNGMIHSTVESETSVLNRFKEVCDSLNIKYSPDLKIDNAYNMANDVILDDIIQHKENVDILNSMGIIDRSTFYRKHCCEPTSPFYIDKTQNAFSLEYVCNLIHSASGKAFFAHPFVYHLDNIVDMMDMMVSNKLIDGIECAHRKHTDEQIAFLINYCDENGILKSGGSDLHTSNNHIGHANNGMYIIDETLVSPWIKHIKTYSSNSSNALPGH